jgi:hypothetical protein
MAHQDWARSRLECGPSLVRFAVFSSPCNDATSTREYTMVRQAADSDVGVSRAGAAFELA